MKDNLAQRLTDVISAFHRANMSKRNSFPIRSSEMGVLIYICLNTGEKGVRSVEISEYFGIRKSSVCTIVDSLEKLGYIEKTKSDGDRRNNPLFPTPKGTKLAGEAFEEYHDVSNKLINKLGEDKCEEFIKALHIVTKIMQKEDDEILAF